MDENPYKAPLEKGSDGPPGHQWEWLFGLAKWLLVVVVFAAIALFLLAWFLPHVVTSTIRH